MNIAAVRTALASKLAPLGIRGYDYTPDSPIVPASYIYPDPFSYQMVFSGEITNLKLCVRLIVSSVNTKGGQAKLDELIAPSGAGSAVAAIQADTTLNSTADSTEVTNLRNYGVLQLPDGNRYFSAELVVDVLG